MSMTIRNLQRYWCRRGLEALSLAVAHRKPSTLQQWHRQGSCNRCGPVCHRISIGQRVTGCVARTRMSLSSKWHTVEEWTPPLIQWLDQLTTTLKNTFGHYNVPGHTVWIVEELCISIMTKIWFLDQCSSGPHEALRKTELPAALQESFEIKDIHSYYNK